MPPHDMVASMKAHRVLLAVSLTGCGAPAHPATQAQRESSVPSALGPATSESPGVVEPASSTSMRRIDEAVLLSADGAVLFVLDPELVALDAQTGREQWRAARVRGELLEEVAGTLVVTMRSADPHPLSVVTPEGRVLGTCAIHPEGVPPSANRLAITPSSSEGALLLTWFSARAEQRGTAGPSSEEALAASGCGSVVIDPETCALRPLPTAPACSTMSQPIAPMLTGPQQHGPLRLELTEVSTDGAGPCDRTLTQSMRVTTPETVWEHHLREVVAGCAAP